MYLSFFQIFVRFVRCLFCWQQGTRDIAFENKTVSCFATEKGHNLSRGVPSECKNNWECPTTLISAGEAPKGMQIEQSN